MLLKNESLYFPSLLMLASQQLLATACARDVCPRHFKLVAGAQIVCYGVYDLQLLTLLCLFTYKVVCCWANLGVSILAFGTKML